MLKTYSQRFYVDIHKARVILTGIEICGWCRNRKKQNTNECEHDVMYNPLFCLKAGSVTKRILTFDNREELIYGPYGCQVYDNVR